jgi:hypothetical protein
MADHGDALVALIRQIVREEIAAANGTATPQRLEGVVTHNFTGNGWQDVTHFTLTSGSRRYSINVGHPVKVKGFGRGGAAQPGWNVTRIQQRGDDINVSVRKGRGGVERTVKADKIIYMRPKKVAS